MEEEIKFELRPVERDQLEPMLAHAITIYDDRDQDTAKERLADISTILTQSDGEVTLPAPDVAEITRALSEPRVRSEHGHSRVDWIRAKIARRTDEPPLMQGFSTSMPIGRMIGE